LIMRQCLSQAIKGWPGKDKITKCTAMTYQECFHVIADIMYYKILL
jgi:hypothetical protein